MPRTATWTNMGTDVTGTVTVDQILQSSGLDYTVHKEDMFLQSGVKIPERMATVKNDGTPIGVVSRKYEVYQNQDAFGFLSDIPDIKFLRAGETGGGMVYIIGKLPDLSVMGDTFTPHVIFQNSHNGRYMVQATICPLRIVCQNQFAMSFKAVRNTISIQHSGKLPQKVAQARQLIMDVATYMNGFSNTAEELALLKITDTDRYAIMDAFFESTKELTARQLEAVEQKKEFLNKCYEEDDNGNFRGTAWGLVNAFADYSTHRNVKMTQKAEENKFMSVTFDPNAMTKLLQLIDARVR